MSLSKYNYDNRRDPSSRNLVLRLKKKNCTLERIYD